MLYNRKIWILICLFVPSTAIIEYDTTAVHTGESSVWSHDIEPWTAESQNGLFKRTRLGRVSAKAGQQRAASPARSKKTPALSSGGAKRQTSPASTGSAESSQPEQASRPSTPNPRPPTSPHDTLLLKNLESAKAQPPGKPKVEPHAEWLRRTDPTIPRRWPSPALTREEMLERRRRRASSNGAPRLPSDVASTRRATRRPRASPLKDLHELLAARRAEALVAEQERKDKEAGRARRRFADPATRARYNARQRLNRKRAQKATAALEPISTFQPAAQPSKSSTTGGTGRKASPDPTISSISAKSQGNAATGGVQSTSRQDILAKQWVDSIFKPGRSSATPTAEPQPLLAAPIGRSNSGEQAARDMFGRWNRESPDLLFFGVGPDSRALI